MSRHSRGGWRTLVFPILSALVAALLLSVVGTVAVRQNERTVRRDGLNRVRSNASAAVRAVTRQSQDFLRTARASARDANVVAALRSPGARTIDAVQDPLTTLASGKDAPAAFLSDVAGRYVAGSPLQPRLVGKSFAYRDWFQGVSGTGRPYVSSGYRSVAVGHPMVVAVAAPVRHHGRTLGYLTVLWQLASVRNVADGSRRDDGIVLHVTDQRGQQLTESLTVDDRGEPAAVRISPTTQQALAGEHVNAVRGNDFLAARPVPDIGWTVTATVPSSAVLAPARAFRQSLFVTIGIAMLMLLGALALTVLTTRRSGRDRAALLVSEKRFRRVFDESLTGQALVDDTGLILHANEALASFVGVDAERLRNTVLSSCFEDGADRDSVDAVIGSGEGEVWPEMRLRGSVGEELWGRVALHRVIKQDGHRVLLAQIEDVTARRLAEHALLDLVLHDDLTGLPNRRLLMERCQQVFAVARSGRSGTSVVALFVDLDGFKAVNDRAGHPAGDRLLSDIAADLVRSLRPADTVARVGGDEFVILLGSDDGLDSARAVAERIGGTVRRQVPHGSTSIAISASIGISRVDLALEPDSSPEQLLQRADAAMYRAKQRGRDRYDVFDSDLLASTEARYQLEQAVRDGLAHDRITLVFQPVVDLDSGAVLGAEALMRLHDADGGLLPTLPAIVAAEHAGLAEAVGDRVMHLALETLRRWPEHLTLAVNVSARELTGDRFRQRVEAALRHHGVDPARLVLEITESSLLGADRSALDALQPLRAAGVRVAIDDFGTSYATLENLTVLPVDLLKVDGSFTAGLGVDKTATAVVHGVITMANAMEVPCIVEGIETTAQLDVLLGLGVQGQGWLWGKPAGRDVPLSAPRPETVRTRPPRPPTQPGSPDPGDLGSPVGAGPVQQAV